MPQHSMDVTTPDGQQITIMGDAPPSEAELQQIFDEVKARQHPGALALAGQAAAGVGDVLNPMSIVHAIRHPIDTATNALHAQMDEFGKAKAMYEQGRTSEAVGHLIAGMLPLLGPAAAHAGEMIGTADPSQMARGFGQSAGLLMPFAARGVLDPNVQAAAGKAIPQAARESVADVADRLADDHMVSAIAPTAGPNKLRFGNTAAKVAPRLAREPDMNAFSRAGLADKVRAGLDEATAQLDAASDARNAGHAFDTQPIIDALLEKRRQLTAEAVEGNRITPTLHGPGGRPFGMSTQTRDVSSGRIQPDLTRDGRPIGQDVVPAPNAARVAQIDQAISEIQQLGPQARYESLRKIRQSYDGPATAKYNESMTADYLKKQGESLGASDVTSVLRDKLASFDKNTAAANAQYSFMKSVSDVLSATEEVERVRPRVGRRLMQSSAGVLTGGAVAGPWGALIGMMTGPMMDAISRAGVTTKIATARFLANAADALRNGRAIEAQRLMQAAAKRSNVWKTAAVGAAEVSPAVPSRQSESPSQ